MKINPLFSRTALTWLIGGGLMSFAIVIVLFIFLGNPKYTGTFGADSFSNSAIGHKIFYQSLKKTGFIVLQSQNRTSEKLTENNLLLILEPGIDPDRQNALKLMFDAENVLLVLPKRTGFPTGFNRRWVGITNPVPEEQIEKVLDFVPGPKFSQDSSRAITKKGTSTRWKPYGPMDGLQIQDPQTIRWVRLNPIVSNKEGILLGKLDDPDRNFFILTDPDVLQNHGLGKGENAAFVFSIISQMGGGRDAIIIDETSHGHFLSPSLLGAAFSPPFLFPLIYILAAILVLIWATAGRFSPPEKSEEKRARDKSHLIQNISNLLAFGGHFGTVTERYYQETLKAVAERLNAPAGLHGLELIRWVDKKNEGRRVSTKFEDLRSRAFKSGFGREARNLNRQVKLARDVFNWKKEVLNGTEKNKKA